MKMLEFIEITHDEAPSELIIAADGVSDYATYYAIIYGGEVIGYEVDDVAQMEEIHRFNQDFEEV